MRRFSSTVSCGKQCRPSSTWTRPRSTRSDGSMPVDRLVSPQDGAAADFAALRPEEIGDRLERRRLAGAVRPEKRDDRSFRDLERHAAKREDRLGHRPLRRRSPQGTRSDSSSWRSPRSMLPAGSARGRALARRDALFLGIGRRLLVDQRHGAASRSDLNPVADDVPLLAVPLDDLGRRRRPHDRGRRASAAA